MSTIKQNTLVIISILLIAITASFAIPPMFSTAQASTDLTTLSPEDVMAYRWEAMAKFYERYLSSQNLTFFNASDSSAYRWQAMANFYASRPQLSADLTTLNAADAMAYRWDAMGKFYARQSTVRDLTLFSRPR